MTTISKLDEDMRRIHKEFTKQVTVYNYTWDDSAGSNEYADGDWSESTSTIQASIRLNETIEYDDDASGDDSEHDVEIWVDPNDLTLRIHGGDETRATEFAESETGLRYRAIGFHDESSLYRIKCREVQ